MQTILVDDQVAANQAMMRELGKLGDNDALAFTTRQDCLQFHQAQQDGSELHYVVDLDLGKGLEVDGIKLVKELRAAELSGQTILISALSSHIDLRDKAIKAGANSFIAKTKPQSDAREVRLKELHFGMDARATEARVIEQGLAQQQYQEVEDLMKLAREQRISSGAVRDRLRKLLAFRHLENGALDVLSALDQWLIECPPAQLSKNDYSFFVRGLRLLKKDDADGLTRWIGDAHKRSTDVILPWLAEGDVPEEEESWPIEDEGTTDDDSREQTGR
ncbi:MAG TPA: response regulator [Povalibacter sp.]|nr:response regulator [Povalibacter sp.]